MEYTSKILMMRSPESHAWEKGGSSLEILWERSPESHPWEKGGSATAVLPRKILWKRSPKSLPWEKGGNMLRRWKVKEEKKGMKMERGGHLYKNSAMPTAAVFMEVRKEEKEGVEVGRGGHL